MSSTKVSQLQILQQNLQNLQLQKQQLELQLTEIDSALNETETTEKAYQIVGMIMIASSKDKILQELKEKKEVIKIRLDNLIKQENNIKENIENLQKEVVAELSKEKKN